MYNYVACLKRMKSATCLLMNMFARGGWARLRERGRKDIRKGGRKERKKD